MSRTIKHIQKNIIDGIDRIRASAEPVKRFWVVVGSGAAMAIVILLWGFYGKVTDAPASVSTSVVSRSEAETENSSPGLFDRLGANVSAGIRVVRDAVAAKNKVAITSREENFIFEDLKSVPSTPLP